jgi:sugar lactone lactonase YvrE
VRRRAWIVAVLLPLTTCSGYFLAWPTGLDLATWDPPEALRWPANQALAGAQRLHPELLGPEAVTIDPGGRVLTGLANGQIVRFDPAGGPVEVLAETGGRPLGLALDGSGNLVVADARRGLLAVRPGGEVAVLATGHGGRPFRFVDDLAISGDGTIYFTDASDKVSVADYKRDILEHRPRGRVLGFHPGRGEVELLVDGLYFPNGIALGPSDAYLIVAETSAYRLRRIWLGARRGEVETLVDNLPGFPDNVRWSPDRRVFWVAIGSPRDRRIDWLMPRPFLRAIAARLPAGLQPGPQSHSFALAYDEAGRLVHDLQASGSAAYGPIASVVEHAGHLYLGSFMAGGIARVTSP